MNHTTGRPQKEAGALLYAINHELVLFISQLADTIAALQAQVEETRTPCWPDDGDTSSPA